MTGGGAFRTVIRAGLVWILFNIVAISAQDHTWVLRLDETGHVSYAFNTTLTEVYQVRLDMASKLYVAKDPAAITKYSINDNKTLAEIATDQLQMPRTLAFDIYGNIIVGGSFSDQCTTPRPRMFTFDGEGTLTGFCDFAPFARINYSLAMVSNTTAEFDALAGVYNHTVEGAMADLRGYRGARQGSIFYAVPANHFSLIMFSTRGSCAQMPTEYHPFHRNISTDNMDNFLIPASNLSVVRGDSVAISPDGTRIFVLGHITRGRQDPYLGLIPDLTDNATAVSHVLVSMTRSSTMDSLDRTSRKFVTLYSELNGVKSDALDLTGLEAVSNEELISYSQISKKFVSINPNTGLITDKFDIKYPNGTSADVQVTDFTTDSRGRIWLAAPYSSAARMMQSGWVVMLASVVAGFLAVVVLL